MSLINKKLVLIIFIIGIFSISCKTKEEKYLEAALRLSKSNKSELLKVLKHYETNKEDLKLKAAKFLISNMPYHGTKTNLEIYNTAFDSLKKYQFDVAWGSLNIGLRGFNKEVKRLNKKYTLEVNPKFDLENLSARFLINHIDSAFNSWLSVPNEYRLEFDDFCEYILPYRNRDEEVHYGDIDEIKKDFNWVSKEFSNKKLSINTLISQIIDSLKINKSYAVKPTGFPVTMNYNQIRNVKRGDCANLTTYAIHVLRAVGIGSSEDYTPHWGDDSSMGHSWLAIHLKDKILIKDVFDNIYLDRLYNEAPISKIYRKTFKMNYENVSLLGVHNRKLKKQYLKTFNVKIPVTKKNIDYVYLCVFDSSRGWTKVDVARKSILSNEINFENLHKNCVYNLITVIDGKETGINYPFVLNKRGEVNFFKPTENKTSVKINRKYPPFKVNDKQLIRLIEGLNGMKLIASNDSDFKNHELLYQIQNLDNSRLNTVKVNTINRKYRYYKFFPKDTTTNRITEFHLIDRNLKVLNNISNTKIEADYKEQIWYNNLPALTDNNPLTSAGRFGTTVYVDLKKPEIITKLKYQAPNRDNNIRIGDNYELFYWNGKWISLGQKTAIKHTLEYNDIPKGALYWLKNHTRGKSEQVFTFSDQGKQIWPSLIDDIDYNDYSSN